MLTLEIETYKKTQNTKSVNCAHPMQLSLFSWPTANYNN